jgi:hypothetical protein
VRALVVCAALCHLYGTAAGGSFTAYITPPTEASSPQPPAGYLAAVSSLTMTRLTFDQFVADQQLNGQDLGGLWLTTNAPAGLLVARQIHGFAPASPPNGVTVPETGQAWLDVTLVEPVRTLGFVLHHQSAPGAIQAWDAGGGLLGSAAVHLDRPDPANRWIGLVADADQIARVRYVPAAGDGYGLDNLEYARAPEPDCLALLLAGLAAAPRRRKRSDL